MVGEGKKNGPNNPELRGFDREEATEGETQLIDLENNTLAMDILRAKTREAVLITIRGTPQGKKYVLNKEALVIGRDKDTDVPINDSNVSRKHAVIKKNINGFTIEDLGSRNGTYLNDIKLQFATGLNKEDMIKIGTTILKYIPAGEIEILYQDNLTNAAYIDELTQVFNRNYIGQAFEAEFKRARALHTSFPVVLFDIDNFKKINDTHGHDAGDFVLRELTSIIKTSGLRERDLLGRWGGEEFILLVSNSTEEVAFDAAERIRKVIAEHKFEYSGKVIPVTISLGVSNIKKEHTSFLDLYKEADQALYASKHSGKNKVSVFK
jgi:two-component system cell cycle response regulator